MALETKEMILSQGFNTSGYEISQHRRCLTLFFIPECQGWEPF